MNSFKLMYVCIESAIGAEKTVIFQDQSGEAQNPHWGTSWSQHSGPYGQVQGVVPHYHSEIL